MECLLCQSTQADKLVKKPSQIANVLDKLKLHEYHKATRYSKINKRIRITGKTILNQSSDHIKCYREHKTSTEQFEAIY